MRANQNPPTNRRQMLQSEKQYVDRQRSLMAAFVGTDAWDETSHRDKQWMKQRQRLFNKMSLELENQLAKLK
jgi:hypothetical protein